MQAATDKKNVLVDELASVGRGEARKRLRERESLCGLCQWKENTHVDEMAFVGRDRS